MTRIFLSPPDVGPAEKSALARAFETNYITSAGPELDAFEAEVAAYCHRRHAVGLSSCTAALHLSLLVLGIKPGDRVVTSTMTFAATVNSIIHAGAVPVLVDCDQTGNMDPGLLKVALDSLADKGQRVAAVMPVDLLGKLADYDRINAIAGDRSIPVVSDAAEGMGATLGGRPAGSFGTSAAVSFNGNKIMTTSGGGMYLTDDEELAQHVRKLSTQAREPVLHYEHAEVGYNYRLSNLLAGLGRAQLSRLPEMMERRRQVREFYRGLFSGVDGVEIFDGGDDREDSCWLTSILVDTSTAGWQSTDLIRSLAGDDIETRPLWKPMHLQPVHRGLGYFTHDEYPAGGISADLFSRGVTLPSGSALTDADLDRIHQSINTFLETR